MRIALMASILVGASVAAAEPLQCPEGTVAQSVTRANGTAETACVFVIYGERQRPYPFTVTGRRDHGWSPAEVSRSFVREVVEPLRRTPF